MPVILGSEGPALPSSTTTIWRSALLEEKVAHVLVTVVADLRRLDPDSFWFVLDNRGWNGIRSMRRGGAAATRISRNPSSDMVDDPFRSLAGALQPRRRVRQGQFAVQRVPVGRFPAPADEEKRRRGGF